MSQAATNPRSTVVRIAFAAVGILLGARLLATLAPDGGISELVLSDRLFEAILVVAAALVIARAVLVPSDRVAWSFIALALSLWAIGQILYAVAPGASYPSLTDFIYVAIYPTWLAGVVLLVRARVAGPSRLLWVDCAIGALAITSLGIALLAGSADEITATTGISSAPTLAYPIGDVVLAMLVVAAAAFGAGRLRGGWLLLTLGFMSCAIVDTWWAIASAAGASNLPGAVAVLWPLGATLIAAAAWSSGTPVAKVERAPASLLVLPAALGVTALAVLVLDHFDPVPDAAVYLAVAAIAALIFRLADSLSQIQHGIEERERLADRRGHSDRLESLGQLAGSVAHDFNNLLTVIRNCADFALEDLGPGSPVRADLEEIRAAADRGEALNRRLLTFSRQGPGELGRAEVGAELNELEPLLARALGEQSRLVVSAPAKLWPVLVPGGSLDQILFNLVVNARDAMPEGGRVAIIAGNHLEYSEDGGRRKLVRLTVADTGIGMTPETADRVFEPFFSTKPRDRGTGLGLSTVYGIIAAAGGEIEIESAPGRGTTVKIELPAHPDAPDELADPGLSGRGAVPVLADPPAATESASVAL